MFSEEECLSPSDVCCDSSVYDSDNVCATSAAIDGTDINTSGKIIYLNM